MNKTTKQSLLIELESIRQEIELGYWPAVRILCEKMAGDAQSLQKQGHPNFSETQRILDAKRLEAGGEPKTLNEYGMPLNEAGIIHHEA